MSTKDYDFKIGAPALTAEGEVGRLKYVVVDPDANVVTHLIVERGRLLPRDIIVPVGWVEHTDAEGIHLNAKLADLEGLPEFREVEFWPPDPATRPVLGHPPVNIRFWISPYSTIPTPRSTWVLHRVGLGMGEGEILIRRGLPVYTADGDRVGTVDHLLVDPARHRVTHLVIHRGRWFSQGEDYIVPLDDVTTASESGIRLRRRRDELGQLARYRADRRRHGDPDPSRAFPGDPTGDPRPGVGCRGRAGPSTAVGRSVGGGSTGGDAAGSSDSGRDRG